MVLRVDKEKGYIDLSKRCALISTTRSSSKWLCQWLARSILHLHSVATGTSFK